MHHQMVYRKRFRNKLKNLSHTDLHLGSCRIMTHCLFISNLCAMHGLDVQE